MKIVLNFLALEQDLSIMVFIPFPSIKLLLIFFYVADRG